MSHPFLCGDDDDDDAFELKLNFRLLLRSGILLVLHHLQFHIFDFFIEYFQVLNIVPHTDIENRAQGNKYRCNEIQRVSKI